MSEDFSSPVLNFERVRLPSSGLPSVVRVLAYDIMETGYIRLGEWIRSISRTDLAVLGAMCEAVDAESDPAAIDALLVLTLMLAQCEGVMFDTKEAYRQSTAVLMLIIAMEGLARKGLVVVSYDNLSLDPSSNDEWVRVVDSSGLNDEVDRLRREKDDNGDPV